MSHDKYQAVDLALEGSVIAGILGGYVSGLITGLCASIPDMFNGKWMSMALFSAAGLIGALIHDLAPRREDVWSFSPFVDLNLWRLLRQLLRLKRDVIQRRLLELAAFNLTCNFLVVLVEALRWGVRGMFQVHGTFFSVRIPAGQLLGLSFIARQLRCSRFRCPFVFGAVTGPSGNWRRSTPA